MANGDLSRYRDVFVSTCDQWDKAEEAMKLAEQVSGKAIKPSINELRYGGRRLADALRMIVQDSEEARIRSFLGDAEFDCLKARHDAIDAATSEMAIVLDIMQKKLGHDAILRGFPNFGTLLRHLQVVRSKLATSRGQRANREAIYESVQATDFPALVDQYQTLKNAEPIIRGLAKRDRRLRAATYVALALAVVAIVAAGLFWRFPYVP